MMRAVIVMFACLVAFGVCAQKTTRKVRPSTASVPSAVAADVAADDTLSAPPCDSVAVAGFEKMLRSRRETFIVSNNMSRDIKDVDVTITYNDMKGRMLHRAGHRLTVDVPAGESRSVSVPSWDLQGVMYYCRSAKPARATQATPFDVSISVNFVTVDKSVLENNEDCHNSSNGQGAGPVAPSD